MKNERRKGENPLKIVRFTDGSMLCAQGSTEEVEKKAKEAHPEKEIAVII